ncbi:MAG: twin-arginine translocation signal domain-containing protein [Phycisphaerae bacterium]|nr:twin-arginine translocation signal domain-containing protein [Phycisphaerae bacterium]
MSSQVNRRSFMKHSLAASAGGVLAMNTGQAAEPKGPTIKVEPNSKAKIPMGKIGKLEVSRMLLGGNLLTHYTHSRDLQYVYNLCAHYNTEDKIHETMAIAEAHGINTLSIHNPPGIVSMLKRYRQRYGGKIQWIICPIAEISEDMRAYAEMAKELVDEGSEALYLWGVRSDPLVNQGRMDLVRKAVEIGKDLGVPSGVGAHDLKVVVECEKNNIPADFYIKTFHHHKYPSAPKPNELKNAYNEVPGYWCRDPQETIEVMKNVTKPWIAFKVMAAGAIPPKDAFQYVFENGADHTLAGMFDFEIAEDTKVLNETLANLKGRTRPWRS